MAVSGYLSAELAATCNALGFYDGQKYHLEPHCKETVRDLIRYLRRDEGGSHEIRRYLGNAKLLQTDLLPMVQCYHKDVQLFDIALRLIVNLTNPALLVYNEVVPKDKFEHNYYLEIVSHLQLYKEAFNDHKSWAPFTERLSELLGKSVEDRSEDDQRTVERILILIRNVLHVPSPADSDQRPDNDASIHDQVLWGLHQSGMIDLMLYISSSEQESLFFMHLLEIICLMLREQPPELLAKTASQRSVEEKNKDDEELLKIRLLELQAKIKKNKKYFGTRHSNFGGTFIIKNMKSASDNNDLIYHKPVHDSKYISLDAEKKPVKLPKNRQPLKCESAERKSALSVRLILKQVCVEFLNAAYNPLMLHVRECFHRGRAQENDESYYFTAMRFFMEFNRHYNFQIKYVSETLSVQTFQFIQKYLETWHEMMITDKKKLPLWSYRSHLALRAYKELLHNLAFMDRSSDESVRESSKVIKSNIFYVVEYREMLLTLVNMYKREKYSRKYLIDLMETIHIFMKLLCDYCKDKKMVIQKTATRRKKKKSNQKKSNAKQDQASAETIWNLACDDVALTLTSSVECDVVPFDATLEMSMDQQKLEAIKKIQFHLKNGDYKQAVAFLRASREVWPENDTFGTTSANAEEELEILRDIFLADLGIGNTATFQEEHEEGSDEEEEEDHYPLILEQNFQVIDFVKRLASPKVVKICTTLLSTYDTNSETTNHCIVKMLYRIAWECKLPAMLFQASLFIVFRQILSNYEPKYKELAKLAVYIVRQFTAVASTNKIAFLELLFPKHVKDACEIVDGYGTYQDSKNKKVAWEEHEEEELRRLDEEYTATNVKEDKVDWIMDNLINKERSKRGVVKKMKELGLEVPETKVKGFWAEEEEQELKRLYEECDKDLPEKLMVNWIFERMSSKEHNERSIKKKMFELEFLQKPVKKLKTWTEGQDEELTELFNESKKDDDVMGSIMATLGTVRSRQNVIGALLRLGLISDKKELRKKSKKSRPSKSNPNQSDGDEVVSEDESDDDDSEDDSSSRNAPEPIPQVGPSAAALFREMASVKYILGGLKWLTSCLNENLEDLDAEALDADVPLLPLSEEPVLSMENAVFQNFIQALGFKKPVQHQEVYWRISAAWKESDFKTRIEVVDCFVENAGKNLEDIADELNRKLAEIVGEDVYVRSGSGNHLISGSQDPNSEDFDAIVQKECNRVLMEGRAKPRVQQSKKSAKLRMKEFMKENGSTEISSGEDSDGEPVARASSSSQRVLSPGGSRDKSDGAGESRKSKIGKVVSRSRHSSGSDVDDPGSPNISRQGSHSNRYTNGKHSSIGSKKRLLSSDDESDNGRRSPETSEIRKPVSAGSDAEIDDKVFSEGRKKLKQGKQSMKHQMLEFVKENGDQGMPSGEQSEDDQVARESCSSRRLLSPGESSDENDDVRGSRESKIGKVVSRSRLSSESDADDPGSPNIPRQGSHSNGHRNDEHRSIIGSKKTHLSSDDESDSGRRSPQTSEIRKPVSATAAGSDAEVGDSQDRSISRSMHNDEDTSDEIVRRPSAKRKHSLSNGSDTDAGLASRKKRNVLDSDDEMEAVSSSFSQAAHKPSLSSGVNGLGSPSCGDNASTMTKRNLSPDSGSDDDSSGGNALNRVERANQKSYGEKIREKRKPRILDSDDED